MVRISLVAFDWQPAPAPTPSCSFSTSYSTAAKLTWARAAQQPQQQATPASCGAASGQWLAAASLTKPAHLAQLNTAWVAEPAGRPAGQLAGSGAGPLGARPAFETVFTAQGSVWGSSLAPAADATPKQMQAWVSVPGALAAAPLMQAICS
jgi:hypothetical protein